MENIDLDIEFCEFLIKQLNNDSYFCHFRQKGKMLIKCSVCNKNIFLNGITSHKKLHKSAETDKELFLIKFFNINDNCAFCKKSLFFESHDLRYFRRRSIAFCSKKCKNDAQKLIKIYNNKKKCIVCKKDFYSFKSSDFCSVFCRAKINSERMKKSWAQYKGTEKCLQRNKKISDSINKKSDWGWGWNRGLKGKDFFAHYEKPDGTNSFYEALKKNNAWFKKTEPEKNFQFLLEKSEMKFRHSFFAKNTQFDFVIWLNNVNIVVEVDGDYWHKSKLKCFDENERKIQRIKDSLKEKNVYSLNDKNNNKKWFVVRFWENDINKNSEKIESFLNEIKITEENQIEAVIQKIKKYYSDKS